MRRQQKAAQMRMANLWVFAALATATVVFSDRADALSKARADRAQWARQTTKLHAREEEALDKASTVISAKADLDRAFHPAATD